MRAGTTEAVPDRIAARAVIPSPVAVPDRARLVGQLARIHARRMLRSPVFLVGMAWVTVAMTLAPSDTPYEAFSAVTGVVAMIVGPLAFFAANLIATSERRSGADEWMPALPVSERDRVTALLAACLAPAAAALAASLAIYWLTQSYLEMTVPSLAHVASVPIVVLAAGVLGVTVSRLLPWTGAPMLVMVALVVFNIWVANREPYLGFYVDFAVWTDSDAVPALQPGSPGWHVAYLAGYLGLAVSGGFLRCARRFWVPFTTGFFSGVLLLVAAVLQLP